MAIVQSTYTEHLTQTLYKLVLDRQTGLMSIEHIGEQQKELGEIYFQAGEIILARTNSERGVTALARIQDWQEAYYTFHEDATLPLQTLRLHTQEPTGDFPHTRRAGYPQGKHTAPLVPHTAAKSTRPLPLVSVTPLPQPATATMEAPEATPPGRNAIFRARLAIATPSTMKRLERRERIVFALLDGKRTVQDIARLTHQSDVSVARILVQLFQQGYIEYLQD